MESADIDLYRQYRDVQDRSYRVRTVLAAWERQQREDRVLRKAYAKWLMGAVSLQVVVAGTAFFVIGFGGMEVPSWVASVFFASTFAEITGLALLVVKYLFREPGSALLALLAELESR